MSISDFPGANRPGGPRPAGARAETPAEGAARLIDSVHKDMPLAVLGHHGAVTQTYVVKNFEWSDAHEALLREALGQPVGVPIPWARGSNGQQLTGLGARVTSRPSSLEVKDRPSVAQQLYHLPPPRVGTREVSVSIPAEAAEQLRERLVQEAIAKLSESSPAGAALRDAVQQAHYGLYRARLLAERERRPFSGTTVHVPGGSFATGAPGAALVWRVAATPPRVPISWATRAGLVELAGLGMTPTHVKPILLEDGSPGFEVGLSRSPSAGDAFSG